MEYKNLNIKETEDKYIITVKKNQLNSEYILNLMNWLQFVSYKPDELEKYLSGLHIFYNVPKQNETIKTRIWNYSGSVNLSNKLDKLNLRDLAYD